MPQPNVAEQHPSLPSIPPRAIVWVLAVQAAAVENRIVLVEIVVDAMEDVHKIIILCSWIKISICQIYSHT